MRITPGLPRSRQGRASLVGGPGPHPPQTRARAPCTWRAPQVAILAVKEMVGPPIVVAILFAFDYAFL